MWSPEEILFFFMRLPRPAEPAPDLIRGGARNDMQANWYILKI